MECRCATIDRLEGAGAAIYAAEHLRRLSVDNDSWDAIYRCPTTGAEWTESFPQSKLHGGGRPLLIRQRLPTQGRT
jgi:Immunity protein 27